MAEQAKAPTETKPGPKPGQAVQETRERFVPLAESEFHPEVGSVAPITAATPPAGTTIEHILRPEYWAHVRGRHPQFVGRTIIYVTPKDNAWWAELLVEHAGPGFAQVRLLRSVVLDQAAASKLVPEGYEIRPLPSGKYMVVRVAGNIQLTDQARTFEDARRDALQDKRMLAN